MHLNTVPHLHFFTLFPPHPLLSLPLSLPISLSISLLYLSLSLSLLIKSKFHLLFIYFTSCPFHPSFFLYSSVDLFNIPFEWKWIFLAPTDRLWIYYSVDETYSKSFWNLSPPPPLHHHSLSLSLSLFPQWLKIGYYLRQITDLNTVDKFRWKIDPYICPFCIPSTSVPNISLSLSLSLCFPHPLSPRPTCWSWYTVYTPTPISEQSEHPHPQSGLFVSTKFFVHVGGSETDMDKTPYSNNGRRMVIWQNISNFHGGGGSHPGLLHCPFSLLES